MRYHSLTILLLLTASGFAQNKNHEYKHAVKIYNLSTYQKTTTTYSDSLFSYNSFNSELQILHPTIAFNWRAKNHNFNELELTTLILKRNNNESSFTSSNGVTQTSSGANVNTTAVSLRYEYIIALFKNSVSKIRPSIGCGINPWFEQIIRKPRTTQEFPLTYSTIGTKGFIIPRLTYYFSPKCFFDLNIPLTLFYVENRFSEPDFKILPAQFSLRLGLGIKL